MNDCRVPSAACGLSRWCLIREKHYRAWALGLQIRFTIKKNQKTELLLKGTTLPGSTTY
jgi:hypothetical protein